MGADIQRRFRYQNAYGAMLLLGQLDRGLHSHAIYFEHHDDLVIDCADGTFIAVQVKTKDSPEPLKATDESCVKAISRFVEHNRAFNGAFSKFQLVSSVGFFEAPNAATDLALVLQRAREIAPKELLSDKRTKSLCAKLIPPLTEMEVHSVLCRVELTRGAPGLNDIDSRLYYDLSISPYFSNALPAQLKHAIDLLLARAYKAASLTQASEHYDATAALVTTEQASRELGLEKRLCPADIIAVAQQVLSDPSTQFVGSMPILRDNLVMRKKLELAQVPANNIEAICTCVYHARAQSQVRKYRLGTAAANAHQAGLRARVHTAFDSRYERMTASGPLDGRAFYSEVRSLTEGLAADDVDSDEFLGIVGDLTDECRIWWSEPTDLSL
ncbi:MAG: dsDNA nuclease domain-containing protein [Candidatus Velthaea sp.]